jgi:hypothetical protein
MGEGGDGEISEPRGEIINHGGNYNIKRLKITTEKRKTYDDSVPSVAGCRAHARLPQLWFLANDTTAVHAAGLWRGDDACEDSLFDASPETTTEDEGSKYDRGRDE